MYDWEVCGSDCFPIDDMWFPIEDGPNIREWVPGVTLRFEWWNFTLSEGLITLLWEWFDSDDPTRDSVG